MVNIVKTPLDVALCKPPCTAKLPLDRFQCSMTASVRSEAMGFIQKNWFINRL